MIKDMHLSYENQKENLSFFIIEAINPSHSCHKDCHLAAIITSMMTVLFSLKINLELDLILNSWRQSTLRSHIWYYRSQNFNRKVFSITVRKLPYLFFLLFYLLSIEGYCATNTNDKSLANNSYLNITLSNKFLTFLRQY